MQRCVRYYQQSAHFPSASSSRTRDAFLTMGETALIIGAGPAGLTAAHELLERSSIKPLILEAGDTVGGICRTVVYKGNRIDIGGHRFFTKSDRVMDWWLRLMPLEGATKGTESIAYQNQRREITRPENGPDPSKEDRVMLLRNRKSRIYFARQFFDYPLRLTPATLLRLGAWPAVRIVASYFWSALHRTKPETTLEQFLINRFGRELYLTFFKSYTEKVWGVPCSEISAEWGAQRIRGLSLWKTILHWFKKSDETSLIEKFLYPKYGPGQLWEYAADRFVRWEAPFYRLVCRPDARRRESHCRRGGGGSKRRAEAILRRLCILHHAGATTDAIAGLRRPG